MPLQVKKVQLKVKDGNQYVDGDMLFNVDAEAWAKGTRNGQIIPAPVGSDNSYPHAENNAKYYSELANSNAEMAIQAIQDQQDLSTAAIVAAGTAAAANFPTTAAACDTLAGDFAATYVPDQAYAVGDYCTYQYQLYQCKTAIAVNTDHTFVTSHWNLITVTDTINDQVDDLKTQFETYVGKPEIVIETSDLSGYTLLNGNIVDSGTNAGKWNNINDNYQHIYIPLPRNTGATLSVTANSSTASVLAFVKSYSTPVSGETPNYSDASGYDTVNTVSQGNTTVFGIPSDCNGIILMIRRNTTDKIPSAFTLTIPFDGGTIAEQVDAIDDNITPVLAREDIFCNRGMYYAASDIAGLDQNPGNIPDSGTNWNNIGNSYAHVVIPVAGGLHFEITANEGGAQSFAVLKSYTAPTPTNKVIHYSDYTGFTQKITLLAGRNYSAILPPDAQYVAVMTLAGGSDRKPQSVSVYDGMLKLKCAIMGDSIAAGTYSYPIDPPVDGKTADNRVDKPVTWAQRVADYNNWDLTNMAIGGTGYLDPKNDAEPGDYRSCGFYIAQNTDFTPYDLVVLAYGINDWKANLTLGTVDDSTSGIPTTVLGAMKTTIEGIMTSNPACKIIVILPLNVKNFGTKADGYGRGYTFSNSGTLDLFADAMITVCNKYGIQYIDMTRYSVLNTENMETLLPDGIHPSLKAHELLARELAKKITF